MTDAERIYLTVCHHLLVQNKQAARADGCMYRTKTGLKCAFGALIADEDYRPAMENKTAYTVMKDWEYLPSIAPLRPYENLITVLQEFHDSEETWKLTREQRGQSLYFIGMAAGINRHYCIKVRDAYWDNTPDLINRVIKTFGV